MKLLEKNLASFRMNGFRLTPQREAILRMMHLAKGSLNIQSIFQKTREYQPSISLDTVYRTLNTFVSLGLAERVKTKDMEFRYCLLRSKKNHSHQAICGLCENSIQIPLCPLDENFSSILEQKGFYVTNHYLEIHGFCKNCRSH